MKSPKETTNSFVYIRYELICHIFNCSGIRNELSATVCQYPKDYYFLQDLHATGSQCATSFLNVTENYIKKRKGKEVHH